MYAQYLLIVYCIANHVVSCHVARVACQVRFALHALIMSSPAHAIVVTIAGGIAPVMFHCAAVLSTVAAMSRNTHGMAARACHVLVHCIYSPCLCHCSLPRPRPPVPLPPLL